METSKLKARRTAASVPGPGPHAAQARERRPVGHDPGHARVLGLQREVLEAAVDGPGPELHPAIQPRLVRTTAECVAKASSKP